MSLLHHDVIVGNLLLLMIARSNKKRKRKKEKEKEKEQTFHKYTNGVGRNVPGGKTDAALRLFYLQLFARI